jgi:hypothetical protein
VLKSTKVPELLNGSFRTGDNSRVKSEQKTAKSDHDRPKKNIFPVHMASQFGARYPAGERIPFEMISYSIKIVLSLVGVSNTLVTSKLEIRPAG